MFLRGSFPAPRGRSMTGGEWWSARGRGPAHRQKRGVKMPRGIIGGFLAVVIAATAVVLWNSYSRGAHPRTRRSHSSGVNCGGRKTLRAPWSARARRSARQPERGSGRSHPLSNDARLGGLRQVGSRAKQRNRSLMHTLEDCLAPLRSASRPIVRINSRSAAR
jgi:hypothetical protein